MSNPNGRKGSSGEIGARDYLRERGFTVERIPSEGSRDRGDLKVFELPDDTIEVKNTKTIDLAGSLDEARKESLNAGTKYYCVIHKRRNHQPAKWYVTLPLELWVDRLLEEK